MSGITLGLDLGPNSIGWALIDEENNKFVATGVRVFPEGVENFDTKKEKPKNETRRIARTMRRQIARRARRKRKLKEALIAIGLFPSDSQEQEDLLRQDPYLLRQKALNEQLTAYELGRVLIHLNQRRGFLSNRKMDSQRKKETQGMLAEISELAAKINHNGHATLGDYLASFRNDPHHPIRNQHTHRNMYRDEFQQIWNTQKKYHGQILIDEFHDRIEQIIFFQRKMYWPQSVVGLCELEPKQRRCPKADRMAQRFRLLQEVNNLCYLDKQTGEFCKLTGDERTLLLAKLSEKKEMKFDEIRKALNFGDGIEFNLERGKRTKLLGMVADTLLAHNDIFGKAWHAKAEDEKNQIVRALIHDDEKDVYDRAMCQWGLNADAADRLLDTNLPTGYANLSRMAIEKLLPHMERGLLYMTNDDTPSALSEAGYLRPDQIQQRICGSLPHPPDLANPIVRQALFEVRKVINAIIREYGKPDRIHIELAREVKAGPQKRQEMNEKRAEREEERNNAANKIREQNISPTRETINKYLLWKEQGEICLYSGKPIGLTQLLSSETHVDHILPLSRSLDDSLNNKVVCLRDANAEKSNRSPYEWLGESDPKRYDEILLRTAKHLPFGKLRKFTQKTLELDNFVSRQLIDTAYISKAVAEYVKCLMEHPQDVLCTKGQLTEVLRRNWGLNTILRHDQLDLKNREDHRHHAVDAIVIALTDRRRLQQLSKTGDGEIMPEPWENFRQEVAEKVNQILVSHRVRRRVSGALHEETIYGKTDKPGQFVYRKPLESLTPAMIEDIRDSVIKGLVIERLRQHGIDPNGKENFPASVWAEPLKMPGPRGALVKRVRLFRKDDTITPLRGDDAYVKPGSNHHVAVFERMNAKGIAYIDPVFVTTLEATMRLRDKKTVIQREHPKDENARFLFSLSNGEAVWTKFEGEGSLYCYRKGTSTVKRLTFVNHRDARRSKEVKMYHIMPGTFQKYEFRKVTIDPIGRIRWAND
jgi:CRISPR-associated endonuclease Csn1